MTNTTISRRHVGIIALIAYIPVLLVQTGKTFTDTKLYLGTDPGGLIANAWTAWDSRLFGGYVPHQNIGYLWPSGPFFWLIDFLSMPLWLGQRIWIGSLFFFAGYGAYRCCRAFGFSASSSTLASLSYMATPFVLSYVTRSSVLLLPWAGLGHIVAVTLNHRSKSESNTRLSRWRDPAIIALIVMTVGGINATALFMIAPAPLLAVFFLCRWRLLNTRSAIGFLSRTGMLSLAASAWWVVAVSVQARFGSRVLAFSETLEAVSHTATSTEVLRGLGHWLNYINSHTAIATTSAIQYLTDHVLLLTGFLIVLLSLLGLIVCRSRAAQFSSALIVAGVVLATGVHPIEDPSSLFKPLAENSESFVALALRSSTRAIPVMLLGLCIALGSFFDWLRPRVRVHDFVAVLFVIAIVINFAPIRNGGLFDNQMKRDESLPQDFLLAAKELNAQGRTGRVLALPGSEFTVYRWGYTMDPPQIGQINQPLITRDLLPLGGKGVMDLFFALDDRLQTGSLPPQAILPVSRLLGVSDIWLSKDHKSDQYNTVTPSEVASILDSLDGLDLSVDTVGTSVYSLVEPGGLAQTKDTIVVLEGSGDGILSAASAGILNGFEAVFYASDQSANQLTSLIDKASLLVVTDSNRAEARQWSGSRDQRGATEAADGTPIISRPAPNDERLDLFSEGTETQDTFSLVRFIGPTRATASSYGNAIKYFPENRPSLVLDGDTTTAWRTGENGNPIGQEITVTSARPFTSLKLIQPQSHLESRWITEVEIETDASEPVRFPLSDASRRDGQVFELNKASSSATIRILATEGVRASGIDKLGGVGFAEIDTGVGSTFETLQVPTRLVSMVGPAQKVLFVFDRQRIRATDSWRSDPEPSLDRTFTVPAAGVADLSLSGSLNPRITDKLLSQLLGVTTYSTDYRLGDPTSAGWAATDGNPMTSWKTRIGDSLKITEPAELRVEVQDFGSSLRIQTDTSLSKVGRVRVENGDKFVETTVDPKGVAEASIDYSPGDVLRIRATQVAMNTTIDPRSGDRLNVGYGISEVSGQGLSSRLPIDLDIQCSSDFLFIDDVAVPVSINVDSNTLLSGSAITVIPCAPIDLVAGEHRLRTNAGIRTGVDINSVVLGTVTKPRATATDVTITGANSSREFKDIDCAADCVMVFSESFNNAWSATGVGDEHLSVDGGFNGWLVDQDVGSFKISFKPQKWINLALIITAITAFLCLWIIKRTHRGATYRLVGNAKPDDSRPLHSCVLLLGLTLLLVGTTHALVVGLLLLVLYRPQMSRFLNYVGIATWIWLAMLLGLVFVRYVRRDPFPGSNWPTHADSVHKRVILALLLLAWFTWVNTGNHRDATGTVARGGNVDD